MNWKWFRCVIYHAYHHMWLTTVFAAHSLFVFLNLIQLRAIHVEVSL